MRKFSYFARLVLFTGGVFLTGAHAALADAASIKNSAQIERGRYLVGIMGCNDCHTSGYNMNDKIPESQRLQGDLLGWSGPWGTTYPTNLRLFFTEKTEAQWLKFAKNPTSRPPMPAPSLKLSTESDLKAIYAYIHALGPAGQPVPAFVPPGGKVEGPVVQFPAPPPLPTK